MLAASKARASRKDEIAWNGEKDRSVSPVPTAASCCSTEHSVEGEEQDLPRDALEPGAPSRTCDQRKISAAVVSRPDFVHKLLQGRPRILLPRVGAGSKPTANRQAPVPQPVIAAVNTADYALFPPPLRLNAWAEANAEEFNVRSKNYALDNLKVPSMPSVFKLLTVDLVKVDQPIITGLCSHPNERIQTALRKERETGVRELPAFIYAVNLLIPGRSTYHWVAYFGLDDVSVLRDQETPLGRVAEPYFFGKSDEYRDKTFKLIPRVVHGNFVVRKAVGSKPSILGAKLKQHYIQNERFFEVVVDIGSCTIAQRIVKLAQGAAKSLVVDMCFLCEGTDESTLPECIMGAVRVSNLDFKQKDGQRVCRKPV
jgi:hypothetical protein